MLNCSCVIYPLYLYVSMKIGKRKDRNLLASMRVFPHAAFAAIIFFTFSSVYSQTFRISEPIERGQAVRSFERTPRPQTVDQAVDLSSRKISASRHIPTPQAVNPVYKTAGKEFYVIFLAGIGSPSSADQGYHRVYISARSRIHGKVSLANGAWQQSFVTNAKGLIAVDFPAWAEMTSDQTEVILPKVFKIEAEDEIAVYGLSHKWLSTDGFLVLPVEALGKNYTVASVRNALYYFGGQVNPTIPNSINPRSELGIAAIADNTTVTVTLTADSYRRKFRRGVPYTFTLNRGETIQIMAHDTGEVAIAYGLLSYVGALSGSIDCDLTGSTVSSDKPIAVFGGHERAGIVDSLEFVYPNHPNVSRDQMTEQMPAQENWGKQFIIVASEQDSYKKRPASGDIIRVIAAYDSTVVLVGGNQIAKLDKGSYTQFPVTNLAYIETSQPALVVKYLRTALSDADSPGDPDLTVVPPLENMSTFYSLPTVADGVNFTEHYIVLLVDSLALSTTTLNGFLLDPRVFKPVQGSRYYWKTFRTYAGSQRVESPLPCYAETYGYGIFDSYSFSGGGNFKYLHDLVAKDLDFGKIATGGIKDSLTGVQSVSVPMPIGDSVTIYGYSWESGDTNTFNLLDTIRQPIKLPPGDLLQVNFKFHPVKDGSFKARLRVWSSNTDDVFINVYGSAGTPQIQVDPTNIDFGAVHVKNKKDSFFLIKSVGTEKLSLYDNSTTYQKKLLGGFFSADVYRGLIDIPPQSVTSETVHFQPLKRGYFKDTIFISSNSQNRVDIESVFLFGRGINYEISAPDYSFGKIRVGRSSDAILIPIMNIGDDSTTIKSISLVSGKRDFGLIQNSLPPSPAWFLDTFLSNANAASFKAFFLPKLDTANNIVDTGSLSAIVQIITTDDDTSFMRLTGTGVEPWFVAAIPVLDFGTVTNPLVSSPAFITLYDTLKNIGSMIGILDSLRHSDTAAYFSIKAASNTPISDNTPIIENNTLPLAVDFNVRQIGDFVDTIYANNDSRNRPIIIAKAKVRAGVDPISPLSLGDISTCMPVDTTITIHNPYRVSIIISSFRFEGDTAGFELIDTNSSQNQFIKFPVLIAADNYFSFHIRYRFPADSLNGSQTVKVILIRPSGGDDLSANYDTILVTLNRKTILLNLSAVMPPYRPSAGDQPFSLPIHLVGNRMNKPELDNDTLRLVFSNKLIKPRGIDRTGSLTESTPTNGIPPQPPPIWDEATSTYSIPCVGLHLSSDVTKNTLLFTLLCDAYLTRDTNITITPFIGYIDQPCAYRVSKDSTWLSYANECGDQTIRGLLLMNVPISVGAPIPNPATNVSENIKCPFFAGKDLMLAWKVCDASGIIVTQAPETSISAGEGQVLIPLKQIRSSGAHYLEVTVRDAQTGAHTSVSSKFTVIK